MRPPIPSIDFASARASVRSITDMFERSATSRSGSGYGSGLKSTASMTLKIAVLAPIPSASVSTVTSVNAGRCSIDRTV